MYIVYIDESGQPGGWNNYKNILTQNSSKYFTLCGFIINADNILDIETKLKDIKIKYRFKGKH